MTQLPLNITPLLSYQPDQFLEHAGVQEAVVAFRALLSRACQSACAEKDRLFQVLFLEGAARTGKTHLSLLISDEAVRQGLYPRAIDGSASLRWADQLPARGPAAADVFIVDNAHEYFSLLQPQGSGDFVRFVEELRLAGSALILLSSQPLESFPCDDHAKSRLAAGKGPVLGAPSEGEMRTLVGVMARQRGIALTDRKLQYLERRLPRDIRQLEEYLDRVQYISHITGKPVRFPVLGDAL